MRFAISLALVAACMAVVSVAALRTSRSTPLAPAPAVAAELRSPDDRGGFGGNDEDNDQRNCPAPPPFDNVTLHHDKGNEIEGRRIFVRENCYICHGGWAGGAMCPSLRKDRPDYEKVKKVVRNGTRNGMPRFPELTDQDIRNLAAYFHTLRTCDEPTFFHWWEPVPTQ